MPSPKELESLDHSTALEILRQKIDAKFINTCKNIRNHLIKIEEQIKWKEGIHFISQLLFDFNQLNNILIKYANTEDLQFRKLFCIAASNISDIVKYFNKLERILNTHDYTSELFGEISKLKYINTFNILLSQMIEYIEESSFDSEIIFEFLTNVIISNSDIVRGSAVKTLTSNFPVKSISLLKIWAEKEVSISVARKVWKHLEESKYEEHHQVLIMLLKKISRYNYNLDLDEIKFLLDWDDELFKMQFPCCQFQLSMEYGDLLNKYPPYINIEKRRGDHDIWIHGERGYPTTIHYTYLKENQFGYGVEDISIYNGHISGLILRDVNKIPDTIGHLSKLKFLSIKECENLTELPESFKNLKNLRYLLFHGIDLTEITDISHLPKLRYLSLNGIELESIPQWVKIKARKYHSLHYIKEGVNKNDACVLGLLEILIGMPLDNVRKKVIEDEISLSLMSRRLYPERNIDIESRISNEEYIKSTIEEYFYNAHGTEFYKINEEGYVTGISISAYEASISLKYLPEEIGNLKYLKELFISTGFPLTLPKSIGNLKSLEYLYIEGVLHKHK